MKKTSKSLERRKEILELIRNGGFSTMPRQRELADKFKVSEMMISKDLAVIKRDLHPDDITLVDLKYGCFVDRAVSELEGYLPQTDSIREKREIWGQMNQFLKDEILIRWRLGIIKEIPKEQSDNVIIVKWKSGLTMRPIHLEPQKVIDVKPE